MGNDRKRKWVSASDVGRASYCPHYLELKVQGASPSEQSVKARAKGEVRHEELNRHAEDRRCFIATHLYGTEDPRTRLLREYRDCKLARCAAGRLFIKTYYVLSPHLVTVSRRVPAIDKAVRFIVDRIVHRLSEDHNNA